VQNAGDFMESIIEEKLKVNFGWRVYLCVITFCYTVNISLCEGKSIETTSAAHSGMVAN
jgi:hypothetical protein